MLRNAEDLCAVLMEQAGTLEGVVSHRFVGWTLAVAATCLSGSAAKGQATNPPDVFLPAQKAERVAVYGCDGPEKCRIVCYPAGGERRIERLSWAVVYKYPNSTRLWLLANGPVDIYLGDTFCDFGGMRRIVPM